MSANKTKYFEVTGTFVVRANNKGEAVLATQRARVPGTAILSSDVSAERIPASQAHAAEGQ